MGSSMSCLTHRDSYEAFKKKEAKRKRIPSRLMTDFGLEDKYEVVQFLGRGGSGETWCMRDRATTQLVAVKLIRRPIPPVCLISLLREITIQAQLGYGCIHIIDPLDVFLTRTHLALVMECARGGNLTTYVADRWTQSQRTGIFVNEDEARYYFKQFLVALTHCHEHCVAHRDLKLDNTLLDDESPAKLLLCDFGFSKTWTSDSNMLTHTGTPVYMAPELIRKDSSKTPYDGQLVDVWASGVLLCVLMLGVFPYDVDQDEDPNTKEAQLDIWVQQMSRKWNELPQLSESLRKLSPECVDLLNRIFVVDGSKRITVSEMQRHPWVQQPLTPRLQAAWDKLQQEQKQLDERITGKRFDKSLLTARNKQIEALVQQAAIAPPAAGSHEAKRQHVNLRVETIVSSPMGIIAED